MEKQKLPLREGVRIIVLNSRNKVFVGKRKDNPNNNWQMPQGGVNNGENYISAMKRELEEETSISNIKVVKELDYYLEYELPKNLVGIIWKGKFRGQKQKWFIVKFLGKDSDINIRTKNAEFIEWKWLDIEDLPKVIVYFKKHIYEKLKKELKKIIV